MLHCRTVRISSHWCNRVSSLDVAISNAINLIWFCLIRVRTHLITIISSFIKNCHFAHEFFCFLCLHSKKFLFITTRFGWVGLVTEIWRSTLNILSLSQGDSMKMYLSSAFKFKAGLKIKQLNEHFSIRLKLPHVLCLPSVSVDINSLSI